MLPPAGAAQELLIVLLDVGGHMHPHLPAVGEALFNAALSKARRGPGGAAALHPAPPWPMPPPPPDTHPPARRCMQLLHKPQHEVAVVYFGSSGALAQPC